MKILYLVIILLTGTSFIAFTVVPLSFPQIVNLNHPQNNDMEKHYFTGIAVNDNSNFVYVADFVGKSIFVLDGHTNKTLDIIPIDGLVRSPLE